MSSELGPPVEIDSFTGTQNITRSENDTEQHPLATHNLSHSSTTSVESTGQDITIATTDYATGYVYIIQKLSKLQDDIGALSLSNQMPSLVTQIGDVKGMVTDMAHQVSSIRGLITNLQQELAFMKEKMQQISDNVQGVKAAGEVGLHLYGTSVTSDEDTSERSGHKSSVHTKQVSSTVPACVIRSCWYKHYNKEMPVTMEYLKKLCDAVCPTLDTSVKSELGIRLRTYIDNHDSNVEIGNSMLLVLSDSNDVTASDGRRAILGLLKGLGTKFAFMLPKSMSELLGRVDVIHTGVIVMATKNASDGVIGLGSGYDIMAEKVINRPRVFMGLKSLAKSNPTNQDIKYFLNAIRQGYIDDKGKITTVPSSKGSSNRPMIDLSEASIVSRTTHNTSNANSTVTTRPVSGKAASVLSKLPRS
jgi:hypothetical protein